jgi:hypothetical protein
MQDLGPLSSKIMSVASALSEVIGDPKLDAPTYRRLHFARRELVDAANQALSLERHTTIIPEVA